MQLAKEVEALSGTLFLNSRCLLLVLSMTVKDNDQRLGTIDLGTEDVGRRVVAVYGGHTPQYIVIEWRTTGYGNLEANFRFIP